MIAKPNCPADDTLEYGYVVTVTPASGASVAVTIDYLNGTSNRQVITSARTFGPYAAQVKYHVDVIVGPSAAVVESAATLSVMPTLKTNSDGSTTFVGASGNISTLGLTLTVGSGGKYSTLADAMTAANTGFSTVIASGSNETFTAGDRVHQFTGTPFADYNWTDNLYMRIPSVTPWLPIKVWNSDMVKFRHPIAVTHAAADWEVAVLRRNHVLILPGEIESAGGLTLPPNTLVSGLDRHSSSIRLTAIPAAGALFVPTSEATDYGCTNLGIHIRTSETLDRSGDDNTWLFKVRTGAEYLPTQSYVRECSIVCGWDLIGPHEGDLSNPGTSLLFDDNDVDGEWNALSLPQMRRLEVVRNRIRGSSAYSPGATVHATGQPNLLTLHATMTPTAYAELDLIVEGNQIEFYSVTPSRDIRVVNLPFALQAATRLRIKNNSLRGECTSGNSSATGILLNGCVANNLIAGNDFAMTKAGTGNAYDISTDSLGSNVRLGAGNHSLLNATLTNSGTNFTTL